MKLKYYIISIMTFLLFMSMITYVESAERSGKLWVGCSSNGGMDLYANTDYNNSLGAWTIPNTGWGASTWVSKAVTLKEDTLHNLTIYSKNTQTQMCDIIIWMCNTATTPDNDFPNYNYQALASNDTADCIHVIHAGDYDSRNSTDPAFPQQGSYGTDEDYIDEINSADGNIGTYGSDDHAWSYSLWIEGSPPPLTPVVAVTPQDAKGGAGITYESLSETDLFYVKGNYTLLGVPLTTGLCNFTAKNISAIFPVESVLNFTLDDSTENLSLVIDEGVTTLINDRYQFKVCRGTLPITLDVLINGSVHTQITNEIPLCSNGFHNEVMNLTDYITKRALNLTLKCSDCGTNPNDFAKILTEDNILMSYERHFASHFEEMTYNTPIYDYPDHRYVFREATGLISISCNTSTTAKEYNIGDVPLTVDFLTLNNDSFINGMDVESTPNITISIDVYGDLIALIEFNATHENGTFLGTSTTETLILTNDISFGLINLTVEAIDDEGTITLGKAYFIYNDTVTPSIAFIFPLEDNSSTVVFNATTTLKINFYDSNYWGREVLIYDIFGTLRYNFTQLGISSSYEEFSAVILPDRLGNWTGKATAVDMHTDKKWLKDKYDKTNLSKLTFSKDEKIKNSKLKPEKKNVDILYITGMEIEEWITIEEKDRIKFGIKFKNKFPSGQQQTTIKMRVVCDDLYYIEDSPFSAHFICYDIKDWIDFVSDDLISYKVNECGENCFDVTMDIKAKQEIIFNSIGGLNVNSKTVAFEVLESEPDTLNIFNGLDFNNLTHVALLFIFAFLWIALLIIAYAFKNPAFLTVGFLIGMFMGIMFISLSGYITLIFFFANVGILYGGIKTFK